MRTYHFEQSQLIRLPVEEVFPFFADANNLEAITPRWMRFEVLTPAPIEMKAGARIEYRLKWRGIPMSWVTEIVEWTPPVRFIDVQLSGPYRLWRHTHEFEAVDEGTHMTDRIEYALPFGPLGPIAHALTVKRDIRNIFAYRTRRIDELMGSDGR